MKSNLISSLFYPSHKFKDVLKDMLTMLERAHLCENHLDASWDPMGIRKLLDILETTLGENKMKG